MLRLAVVSAILSFVPIGALAQEPAPETPATEPEPAAGSTDLAREAIDRGLSDYWRHDWAGAAAEFQAALDAEPQNPAATFYLGYAIYKRAEWTPFHPDKQRAKELFARAFELDPSFAPTFQRSGR